MHFSQISEEIFLLIFKSSPAYGVLYLPRRTTYEAAHYIDHPEMFSCVRHSTKEPSCNCRLIEIFDNS